MRISSLLLFFFLALNLNAQNANGQLDVFVDCQTRCYFSFLKQEVNFINYMNDRQNADVYVLATSQRTGSGGREIQFVFNGRDAFEALTDTISYFQDADATESIARTLFVSNFKSGLLPFLSRSSMADRINYSIEPLKDEKVESSESNEDPWNFWVFNIGGNINLNAESNFNSQNYSGRLSVSRVTEENKFHLNLRANSNQSKFTFSDGEEFRSVLNNYSAWTRYVISLNDHWSLGVEAEAGSSTFGNTDFFSGIKPAVEFNIYPYSEAQTKRFSFLYRIGPEFRNYTDTTIYLKVKEVVIRQGFNVEYELIKEWGDVSFNLGVNQYLHNLSLYSIYANPNITWQIATGLRVNFGGYVSFVRDRINIAKSNLSNEEILLQLKQLDTDFTYYTYIGLNYRFGSRFNNFVNPRF